MCFFYLFPYPSNASFLDTEFAGCRECLLSDGTLQWRRTARCDLKLCYSRIILDAHIPPDEVVGWSLQVYIYNLSFLRLADFDIKKNIDFGSQINDCCSLFTLCFKESGAVVPSMYKGAIHVRSISATPSSLPRKPVNLYAVFPGSRHYLHHEFQFPKKQADAGVPCGQRPTKTPQCFCMDSARSIQSTQLAFSRDL